jgi:hypothetical protein
MPMLDSAKLSWYQAKSPLRKKGVAVPLLFRVAMTSDAKDYLAKRKTRRLWTMPMEKALALAQAGKDAKATSKHGTAHTNHRKQKHLHVHHQSSPGGLNVPENGTHHSQICSKRDRVDDDGDAIMVRKPCFASAMQTCTANDRS